MRAAVLYTAGPWFESRLPYHLGDCRTCFPSAVLSDFLAVAMSTLAARTSEARRG